MPLLRYAHLYLYLDLPPEGGPLHTFLHSYFSPYFEWVGETSTEVKSLVTVRVHVGTPAGKVPDFASAPLTPIDNSQGFLHCEGRIAQTGKLRWVRLQPYDV